MGMDRVSKQAKSGEQRHAKTVALFRAVMKGKRLTKEQINERMFYKNCSSHLHRLKHEGMIAPCFERTSKNKPQKFKWIGD